MGNHLMLMLIQILIPVEKCDVLISCKEEVMGIPKYLMIWKPEWKHSKDLLRRLGWSMVEAAAMNPSRVEVPMGQFVKMNILMWNCRGALNLDFKRRVFEMVVNHRPSIMVITETRVGGSRAEKIIEALPFDGFITTETIGYAGGLWILWKSEDAEVKLLSATEQEIHATVKVCASNLSWLFTAIYASSRLAGRRILWSNIEKVGQLHDLPWLMIGDFNEILSEEDKFGGNHINLNRALEFKECLDSCNFVDLGFAGPKYTWTNKRQISDLILERLDRCFANPIWRIMYPEPVVTHLPRTFSDHHPVLIELWKPNANGLEQPFRFQTMWLLHPDFYRIVREAWPEGANLTMATTEFMRKAKKWNYEAFGNLFVKKKRVLARLNGTQKELADYPSESLLSLENQLIEEYSSILLQEEEFWALKSKINAAAFGDRNTSYFHMNTVVRRQRNKIRCFKDGMGKWILEEEAVKEHILNGFMKLYSTDLVMSYRDFAVSEFSGMVLSNEDRN
ncbi:uncharacterized protein LOC111990509 [Quercus suber]|uniref:uncharacterized protein LOC111990509 n=1 Tax=Quercus suber TaxID=58331 RepID=UPI000CE26CD6|nr:uncharacterized protein LOC111990509 [Quercus suber]